MGQWEQRAQLINYMYVWLIIILPWNNQSRRIEVKCRRNTQKNEKAWNNEKSGERVGYTRKISFAISDQKGRDEAQICERIDKRSKLIGK